MTKEKGRARHQVARLINQATPVVTDWVARRRRADLPTFLGGLARTTPQALLTDPTTARDAHEYLVTQWPATVEQVARPESLPEVVARREQVRVHPAAPTVTAAVASGGSLAVVAADLAAPLEVLGVVGVVAVTAIGSVAAWRPRARARDRQFTLSGTEALVARAQHELAAPGLTALGSGQAADDQLTRLLAAAHHLDEIELEATRLGLLGERGAVAHPPRTPAEQGLMGEVLAGRVDLVHAMVSLGQIGQAERARQRSEERDGFGLGPG